MNEPLLVFRGIEKSFAGSQILRNVDLLLYPGNCILLSVKNVIKLRYETNIINAVMTIIINSNIKHLLPIFLRI